jgi:adenosylcobinamide-GDP ribazoletransferase
MKAFLLAVQFLTVAPVRVKDCDGRDLARSLVFFPLVGLLLGAAIWLVLKTAYMLDFGGFAYAIVPVVLLAAFTGGLHLDGLADTADALASGKNKEGMLEIMRDPRCGALGVVALVCCLLLKIAFLASIPLMYRGKALMLVCVSGRWPLVLLMYVFPYARAEGKAMAYTRGINGKILLSAGAVALACSLVAGIKGALVLAAVSLAVVLFNKMIKNKIGGITGDTLGASAELAELSALFLSIFIF